MKDKTNILINQLIDRYGELAPIRDDIETAASILITAARKQKKILVCGNGGSCADADHIVGELAKSFILPRPLEDSLRAELERIDPEKGPLMAKSLQSGVSAINLNSHQALNSAFANDVDPALNFAQQVIVYGGRSDVLWALTTSGNSKNILNAAVAAKAKGMKIVGFTGSGGGQLKSLCDVCICVPRDETYKVQELHLPIYHSICLAVEQNLWG
ncbi:MAG: SIS domain-containing protein [Sphaerochaetaceae bacterium]|nr:SIS domain-containing protein [Sphaerochaetaceae bacterium]